jgi:hypothetical protein
MRKMKLPFIDFNLLNRGVLLSKRCDFETGSWRGVLDTTLCDNVHWSYIVLDMVMCTYAVLIVLDMVMCTYHAVLIVLRHGDVYISCCAHCARQ